MNTLQQFAYDEICNGKNIFITGGAGVGKTYIIKYFYNMYRHEKYIGITSTTGISSLLIGGSTLHSYLGIGLGKGDEEVLFKKIKGNKKVIGRWKNLQILIIDEVSMLTPELFDKLNILAKRIRRDERPFGGIQLILSGDFCQLPPVENSDYFLFESYSWKECIEKIIYLQEVIRQSELDFIKCLNEIRLGNISSSSKKLLKSRINKELENEFGIIPTRLYPLNRDVHMINVKELEKIDKDEIYEYNLTYEVFDKQIKHEDVERYFKNLPIQDTLELTKNCQVVLVYNLNQELGLVNGSRGVVVGFVDDLPMVRFLNGLTFQITHQNWNIEIDDKVIITFNQIPLKLGYASTIHSNQGSTLDYVELDLKDIFGYGMAYVALSRIKSLEGLNIMNSIPFNKIKAHPKCIEFYNNLS